MGAKPKAQVSDMARLTTLKPRVQMLGSSVRTLAPGQPDATLRERGRRWMRRRAAWLYAHPLCCHCQASGHVTAATIVDHVIPLWQSGPDDESNLQSLCRSHSDIKTASEAAERGNISAMR